MSTWASVIAIITGVATIIGGFVYFVQASIWAVKPTEDQVNQDIDAQEQKNKQEAEKSGRPV